MSDLEPTWTWSTWVIAHVSEAWQPQALRAAEGTDEGTVSWAAAAFWAWNTGQDTWLMQALATDAAPPSEAWVDLSQAGPRVIERLTHLGADWRTARNALGENALHASLRWRGPGGWQACWDRLLTQEASKETGVDDPSTQRGSIPEGRKAGSVTVLDDGAQVGR